MLDVVPQGHRVERRIVEGCIGKRRNRNVDAYMIARMPRHGRCDVDADRVPAGSARLVDEEACGSADVEKTAFGIDQRVERRESTSSAQPVQGFVTDVILVALTVCLAFGRVEVPIAIDSVEICSSRWVEAIQEPARGTADDVEAVLAPSPVVSARDRRVAERAWFDIRH